MLLGTTLKTTATNNILKNEDVLYYWSELSSNWEEEDSGQLLHMIVELCVTERGFAYVSFKNTIQKSKE